MAKLKKRPLEIELEKIPSSIRMRRLHWGESKRKLGTLMTPSGHALLINKAAQLQMSKSDLLEYLSRCLDDPAVLDAIARQIID
jgi:hypothetical protein